MGGGYGWVEVVGGYVDECDLKKICVLVVL